MRSTPASATHEASRGGQTVRLTIAWAAAWPRGRRTAGRRSPPCRPPWPAS